MIEILVIDVCALLLAPELRARLLLAQAEKDGLYLFVYGDMPKKNLRRALRMRDFLNALDGIFYEELMLNLTSEELRRLADTSKTLWLRTPEEVDYNRLLPLLGRRRRLLPRALRLFGPPLANASIIPQDSE